MTDVLAGYERCGWMYRRMIVSIAWRSEKLRENGVGH